MHSRRIRIEPTDGVQRWWRDEDRVQTTLTQRQPPRGPRRSAVTATFESIIRTCSDPRNHTANAAIRLPDQRCSCGEAEGERSGAAACQWPRAEAEPQ